MIRGLRQQGTGGLVDIMMVNTDSCSHRTRTPDAVLKTAERTRRRKRLHDCQTQLHDFTPFIVSTDGLLGDEATAMLKRLGSLLAVKWGKPYSQKNPIRKHANGSGSK